MRQKVHRFLWLGSSREIHLFRRPPFRRPSEAGYRPRWNDFVSTSEPYPRQNAFRGTLLSEVNFTGQGNPRQKCLWGRLGGLVKFTFSGDPLQKAFWGRLSFEVERLCVHLRALPPPECLQRHIAFRGEFHHTIETALHSRNAVSAVK